MGFAAGLAQVISAATQTPAPVEVMAVPPTWQVRLRRWALRKAGKAGVRVVQRVWRLKRILAPWHAAMTVWVVAAVAGQVEHGWRTVAAVWLAGCVPLWQRLGLPAGPLTRIRKIKPLEQRVWQGGFYVLLGVWGAVGAAWTVRPPWLGVLWVGTFVVWGRWMWHHRTRRDKPKLGALHATWATVKGVTGTQLANVVELTGPKRWEADVRLADTELLVNDVAATVSHVAKRFRVPVGNVIVDYTPSRLEDTARLTVVQENPCHDAVIYDESWIPTNQDAADGCVPFHLYPNGTRGRARLWLSGAGCVNALFTGDVRTGKSAGMEAKMLQAAWTGKVWPMAADPQGGVSMPVWCKRDGSGLAKWQATDLDGIYRQLCGWRAAMYARSDAMSQFRWVDKWGDEQVGVNCWDPAIPGMPPAVAWACDEFWSLMLLDDFYLIFKECLKMQGKVGMLMDIATQYPGIEEFHNDMALRQPLTAGNLFCYRNTATSTKEMILPRHLPSPLHVPWETPDGQHTKGTMIAASQAPRSSLPVYSRSVWAERGRHWATKAMERAPELDDVTADAFEKWMKPADQASSQPQREQIVVAAVPVKPAKRARAIDRIVAYLGERADGQAHTGVIASALDMPKGTVGTALRRAEKSGVVREVRDGIWAASRQVEKRAAA